MLPVLLFVISAAASPEPLRVWHAYRATEAEIFSANVGHEAPGTVVSQIPYDNLQSKLMQALTAGVGPDLFVAPHERLEDWWRYLDPAIEDGSDVEVAKAALLKNGVLYGHPYALKTLALIRHAKLAPDPVATLDALEPLAPAGGFALGYDTSSFYFHSPFFFAASPELFDGDRLAITTPAALASFQWVREATRRGRFLSKGLDHTQLVSQFRAGKIAALVDGPWLLSDLDDARTIARVQALPPFVLDGRSVTPRPFATIDALFVVKGPRAKEAHALAIALQGEAHCRERTEIARQLPALERCRALLSDADAPLLGPFFDQLKHATAMPTTRAMGTAWLPLKDMLSFAVATDEPLRDAAEKSARAFDRLMLPDRAAPIWLDVVVIAALGAFVLWRIMRARRTANERGARPTTVLALFGPTAAFVVVFLLVPLAMGSALAFFSHDAGVYRWVGVGNFIGLLSHGAFYTTLLVTIAWTVVNLAIHATLGIALALALDHPRVRLKRWFRALLILPWAIPNYISALVFHNLFNFELGAINGTLAALGLARVDWFGSFLTSFTANVTANAWLGFPFVMIVTLGALQSIDKSLAEAMRLDGAGAWQRFRHLTLPSIAPVIAPAMILSAIWTFNMFNIIFLVSCGEPRGETDILISEAYRWAFTRGARYGYAAAYCAAIFAFLQLLTWLKDRGAKHA